MQSMKAFKSKAKYSPSETLDSKTSCKRDKSDSRELMHCDICMESYDDGEHEAKFLSCHHSFCLQCLQRLAKHENETSPGTALASNNQNAIECPTCRHVTSIPGEDVRALQTNFYISHVKEALDKVKEALPQHQPRGCPKHGQQPLSFFCKYCQVSICRDCTVIDHRESLEHRVQDVEDAHREQRQLLASQIQDGHHSIGTMQSLRQQVEREATMLCAAKDYALEEIESLFLKCTELLKLRKNQLTKTLLDHFNVDQNRLLTQGNLIEECLTKLSTSLGECEQLLEAGSLDDTVILNDKIHTLVEEANMNLETAKLGRNLMIFDQMSGFIQYEESVKHLGHVISDNFLPARAKFSDVVATAGLETTIVMQLLGMRLEALPKYPISVNIAGPQGDSIECNVVASDVDYQITFLPRESGKHYISALFLGQPIRGADLVLHVRSNEPVQLIGGKGSGKGYFFTPRAVAVDKDGSIYVADTGNRLIQHLSQYGDFINEFKIQGHKGEDCSTCDVAINIQKGLLLCTETIMGSGDHPLMGNRILMFNKLGKLKEVVTNKIMKCALCIAVNSRGDIIISDYMVHSLFMYDSKGSFLRRVGHAGTFNHPAFICIAPNDSIIVSDTNNDCIQVFDSEGNFYSQFGKSGSGPGELRQPFGVATDGLNILVVDSGNKRIQVFTKDGEYVSVIESLDEALDQPRGIAVAGDGHHCFVADRENHYIKKYKYR